ncbi:MAG: prolipoprotein diacylglyceryl transferase [Gemmatimonadetes bacterium]|nr:prolipoprotein diacylglyceryl transferase [Gemmatimonadota bacterium]
MPHTVLPFEIPIYGSFKLTGFGIAVFMAFAISQVICQVELTRRGHKKESDAIPDIIIYSILGTIVGGKVYYSAVVTGDWSDLLSRAGFVFWGGFMGAVLANWIFITSRKLSFPRFADVAGIAIAAGYSVGRTGCWAVGDDYGRPWDGPLAVMFPQGAPPSTAIQMNRSFGVPIPDGVAPETVLAVHPTQLYETFLGFLMFLVVWRFRNHKHAEGWLFGVYCVLAGAERFVIEFFRAKDDRFFGPLTAAQVIGLAIMAIGVAVMAARSRTGPGKPGIYAASPATA